MIPQMGYDRAITVFSPDGRLFQVEYAREAVKRGTTAIGIKASDSVILLADKRIASKLLEVRSLEKIFPIDEHIGAVTSGLVADARVLIDRGRLEAQINRIIYDEPIDVATLARKICDFKQIYTQIGGLRPFGTALLIAGVYEGEGYLFETDPSGALLEYKATAIGAGRNTVMEILESEYSAHLSRDEAISLGLRALLRVTESGVEAKNVEIGVADIAKGKFSILSEDEVRRHVERVRGAQEEGRGAEE